MLSPYATTNGIYNEGADLIQQFWAEVCLPEHALSDANDCIKGLELLPPRGRKLNEQFVDKMEL